jgi:SH3-like domain-containing protein
MQSIHALRLLPVVAGFAAPLASQTRVRVASAGEWFYQAAQGKRLAQLEAGVVLEQDAVQGDWVQVTLDGWIFKTSVGPSKVAGFDLAVSKAPSENLRAAPAGAVVAHLTVGFGLDRVGDQDSWVHVRRQGWMRGAALAVVSGGAAPAPGRGGVASRRTAGVAAADTVAAAVDPSRLQVARTTTVFRAPEGGSDATLAAGAPVTVLGRSGEWTRIELEGWVKTADLQSAPAGVLVGVTAAELRAEPDRYVGQTLRWTLQIIALRTADDLRPDIPDGATYLLARGPAPERGFVYVVVPDANRAAVEALPPLATVQITARVRVGRSRFVGNPVVDLVSLEVQP